MLTRRIRKTDYDYIVSELDRWWGGPSQDRAHPMFFYEFGQHALITEDNDRVVGFLLGVLCEASDGTDEPITTGYVHLVGIDPEYRRRGVGKRLYEQFVTNSTNAGAKQLKAITTPGNDNSIRFHEALGFASRYETDYAGPGRARVVFTRKL